MKCPICNREIGCQSRPKAPMVIIQNVPHCGDCAYKEQARPPIVPMRVQKGGEDADVHAVQPDATGDEV